MDKQIKMNVYNVLLCCHFLSPSIILFNQSRIELHCEAIFRKKSKSSNYWLNDFLFGHHLERNECLRINQHSEERIEKWGFGTTTIELCASDWVSSFVHWPHQYQEVLWLFECVLLSNEFRFVYVRWKKKHSWNSL